MDHKKTIVCFGDSNTHGYDAATGGRFAADVRWPGVLQAILGEEYLVREEGLSGRTCVFDDPLFEGLSGLEAIGPVLLTHEPVDQLIIMLGTNDTKQRFSATAPNIAKGLERLLTKAKNRTDAWKDGEPRILVICPPPIGAGYRTSSCGEEMGDGCDVKSLALPDLYEDIAKRLGCDFLDAGAVPGIVMNDLDFMHLTAASHRKLAEAVAARIDVK